MNAKTKAIELVRLFTDNVNPYIFNGILGNIHDDEAIVRQSKICATMCAKQIVDALSITTGYLELNPLDNNEVSKDFDYWKKVVEEINLVKTEDIFKD